MINTKLPRMRGMGVGGALMGALGGFGMGLARQWHGADDAKRAAAPSWVRGIFDRKNTPMIANAAPVAGATGKPGPAAAMQAILPSLKAAANVTRNAAAPAQSTVPNEYVDAWHDGTHNDTAMPDNPDVDVSPLDTTKQVA